MGSQRRRAKLAATSPGTALAVDGATPPQLSMEASGPAAASKQGLHDLDALLTALLTCFQSRVEATELELLLFSLRQLFSRLAMLHLQTLPDLAAATRPLVSGEVPPDDLAGRHAIWLQLRALRAVLRQIDILCKLLVGAGEDLLTKLDSEATACTGADRGGHGGQPDGSSLLPSRRSGGLQAESLSAWQAAYRRLPPFALQFVNLPRLPGEAARLDVAFATLLEEAGAIFGELLPSLHPQALSDELAPALFLTDLVQHLEQIGLALDGIWELLASLEEAFLLETLL